MLSRARCWLRCNVATEALSALLASGCFLVARWCAAACVLMLAALVAVANCACAGAAKSSAYPARDEVHAAMFSAIWGIRVLNKECYESSMDLVKADQQEKALFLAQSCDARLEPAKEELTTAMHEVEAYGPDTVKKIGCRLSATQQAYSELRVAMEKRGHFDVDVEDGQARTAWLVAQAGDCSK